MAANGKRHEHHSKYYCSGGFRLGIYQLILHSMSLLPSNILSHNVVPLKYNKGAPDSDDSNGDQGAASDGVVLERSRTRRKAPLTIVLYTTVNFYDIIYL